MFKLNRCIASLLLVICASLGPQVLLADENSPVDFGKDTLRMISANRSLLAQSEADLERFKAQIALNPTGSAKRDLEKTEYKIKALREESVKLLEKLPEETKADELVKYVLLTEDAKKSAVVDSTLETLNADIRTVSTEPEKYAQMHDAALDLVSQHRYDEALKIYEDILLIRPDDDQAFMIMGHLYVMTGRFDRAEKSFYSAAEIDPRNTQDVIPFYQNQILKDPNDDDAHTNLGYVFLMFNDLGAAKTAFRDALSINPDNELALAGLDRLSNITQQNL